MILSAVEWHSSATIPFFLSMSIVMYNPAGQYVRSQIFFWTFVFDLQSVVMTFGGSSMAATSFCIGGISVSLVIIPLSMVTWKSISDRYGVYFNYVTVGFFYFCGTSNCFKMDADPLAVLEKTIQERDAALCDLESVKFECREKAAAFETLKAKLESTESKLELSEERLKSSEERLSKEIIITNRLTVTSRNDKYRHEKEMNDLVASMARKMKFEVLHDCA